MNNFNPMFSLLSGQNPQQVVQQLINTNPSFQMMMNQVNSSGLNIKDYAQNYAKQHNINLNQIIGYLNQRGIRL